MNFRTGFLAGLILAAVCAVWLWLLWQPARQVELHSEHLLTAVQAKNWSALENFLDPNYRDQWNQDRPLVLSRLRQVLHFARNLRLTSGSPVVVAFEGEGDWSAPVTIEADANEMADLVKARVNKLDTPFQLHWQRKSWKPWDWKLMRVENSALEIPASDF